MTNDFLLKLSANPNARSLVKQLGLPIPLPENLKRTKGPYEPRPLVDQSIVVSAIGESTLAAVLAEAIAGSGANPVLASASLEKAFKAAGEAHGRPAKLLAELSDNARVDALVLDASGLKDLAGLKMLYEFFHPWLGRLARSGRVLVLARTPDELKTAEEVAASTALDGFVKSVAKEIGKSGATANLVYVAKGADARVVPVVRFFLSARSAFVTAQPLHVSTLAKGDAPVLQRPLEKKIALVTGAARGIGAQIATQLAAEGAHVVVLDRPADDGPLSQLARELSGTALAVDVTAPDAPAKIAEALKALGGVDIVIHNAGITRDKTLARMKPELWDQVVAVNLEAVAKVTAALEPLLRPNGRIVALSSVAGIAGNVGQTAYALTKSALVGWVKKQAEKHADKGITVNAIAPGFIETRLTAAIPIAIREVARRLSALGQGGQPEDVAAAIVFLSTPGAQGVSGRTLRVCGGALVGA